MFKKLFSLLIGKMGFKVPSLFILHFSPFFILKKYYLNAFCNGVVLSEVGGSWRATKLKSGSNVICEVKWLIVTQRWSVKIGKYLYWSTFFNKVIDVVLMFLLLTLSLQLCCKETPMQVFSWEIFKHFKNSKQNTSGNCFCMLRCGSNVCLEKYVMINCKF